MFSNHLRSCRTGRGPKQMSPRPAQVGRVLFRQDYPRANPLRGRSDSALVPLGRVRQRDKCQFLPASGGHLTSLLATRLLAIPVRLLWFSTVDSPLAGRIREAGGDTLKTEARQTQGELMAAIEDSVNAFIRALHVPRSVVALSGLSFAIRDIFDVAGELNTGLEPATCRSSNVPALPRKAVGRHPRDPCHCWIADG